jgi:hypothetical protein
MVAGSAYHAFVQLVGTLPNVSIHKHELLEVEASFQYSGSGKDVQDAIDVDLEMDDDEDFESGKRLVDPGESIASAQEFMK